MSFDEMMRGFCVEAGMAFYTDRKGSEGVPHTHDDIAGALARVTTPVAMWHNIHSLNIVIEDISGHWAGIRQMSLRVPLFGFRPGCLEELFGGLAAKLMGD